MVIDELGKSIAAVAKNEEVEGSPGTLKLINDDKLDFEIVFVKLFVEIVAPNFLSIISVWFLDRILSVVEVLPVASIPANRIADFICALGISELCLMPFKSLLKIEMGSLPSLLFNFNPILANGFKTLSIGLDERD